MAAVATISILRTGAVDVALPFPPELIETTARFKRLNKLDEYFKGTQYKGRPDFWTGGPECVPLRERAPCVVYPLPKACVNQATRFTFGEGRFPTITAHEVKAEDAAAPGLTVSDAEAEVLEAAVAGLIEQASLRSVMRTLLRRGLACRTGVAVVALRGGKYCIDLPHPKNCIPVFVDPSTCELASLTIVYRFTKEVYDPKAKVLLTKQFWYRRDITVDAYVVYQDAEIVQGKDVEWLVDKGQTIRHGLGLCPAIWIPNLREDDGDPDGCSLYEGLEDEFDALNFALSQRHRGINYWGVPQPWENLGPDGTVNAATGRAALVKKDGDGRGFTPAGGHRARKAAPDQIWTYRVEKAEVGLLETTGKAFDAATKHVLDVRARILEAIDVVLMDPATIAGKGDISAKALSYMYAPLLALVDELRECWWTKGLQRILGMMFRIMARLGGVGIYVPGVDQATPIAQRFLVDGIWFPPPLTPVWGEYFSPSNAEIQAGVTTAVAAKGVLVTQETATKYVANYFGVQDVDDEIEELTAKQEEEQAATHDQQLELMAAKKPNATDQSEPMTPAEKK